jgi:hypothetical protein
VDRGPNVLSVRWADCRSQGWLLADGERRKHGECDSLSTLWLRH